VLSGYVLMLPVLRSPDLRMSRGNFEFFKRRGRRILPPYYAALGLSIGLILLIPVMRFAGGTQWDTKIPMTVTDIVAHLLLLQDASPGLIGKINGPMWSVAIEWQIYFLMPFVLLPLWRRIRPLWIVGGALLVSYISVVIQAGTYLHPWFVALFAAGMWASQLTLAPRRPGTHVTSRAKQLAFLFGVVAVVSVIVDRTAKVDLNFVTEVTVGGFVAASLVVMGRSANRGSSSRAQRFFGSRPMLFFGLFSYSLYLLHSPLLALGNLLLLPLGLPTFAQWAIMTFMVAPIAIAACYVFFLLVERRFLNARQQHAKAQLSIH
jgi:peptidoglycan/LPS O-acetylase OafA/YrhL